MLNKFKVSSGEIISNENDSIVSGSVPTPKLYATACTEKDKSYIDYENWDCLFNAQDDYEFTMKLGRGRYSEVFRGVDLLENKDVVVKILKPVKMVKVRREIKILNELQGGPFII
jgi:casein kinase II subunit alpha